jgi:predicted XRE-type DNA-binding protein
MSAVLAIVKGTVQRQDQYILVLSELSSIPRADISDLVKDKCQWIVADNILILTNTTIQHGMSSLKEFAIFIVQVFVHLCLCNVSKPEANTGVVYWVHMHPPHLNARNSRIFL